MKKTIVLSRTKFEGQDWRRGRKILKNTKQQRWKLFRQKGAKFRAVTKIVRTRHVICGILPCVKTTILRQDEKFGRTCFFRHVKAEEKPSKKSKKGGAKGSVALLKESTQLGCVSEDSYPRKSIQRAEGKLGSKHAVKLSKGTWHQKKKPGKTRVHRKELFKQVWTSRAQSLRAKIRRNSTGGYFAPRKMRPQSSMGFVEKYLQAQECRQSYVLFRYSSQSNASTYFKISRRAKETQTQIIRILCEAPRPPLWCLQPMGEVHTNEEAQVFVHDLNLFVTVQLLEETPAVLSLAKLCEDHGYSNDQGWPQRKWQFHAKRTTSYLLLFQGYSPVLVAIRRHRRHRRICLRQVQPKSEVTDKPQETGADRPQKPRFGQPLARSSWMVGRVHR